jgi:hypothetical protein
MDESLVLATCGQSSALRKIASMTEMSGPSAGLRLVLFFAPREEFVFCARTCHGNTSVTNKQTDIRKSFRLNVHSNITIDFTVSI